MFQSLLRLCLLIQHERVTKERDQCWDLLQIHYKHFLYIGKKRGRYQKFIFGGAAHPRYSREHHHQPEVAVRQSICLIYDPWFPWISWTGTNCRIQGAQIPGAAQIPWFLWAVVRRATPRNCTEGIFGYEEMAGDVLENTALVTWWHIKNGRWWQERWGQKTRGLSPGSSSSMRGRQHEHGDAAWFSTKGVSWFHTFEK